MAANFLTWRPPKYEVEATCILYWWPPLYKVAAACILYWWPPVLYFGGHQVMVGSRLIIVGSRISSIVHSCLGGWSLSATIYYTRLRSCGVKNIIHWCELVLLHAKHGCNILYIIYVYTYYVANYLLENIFVVISFGYVVPAVVLLQCHGVDYHLLYM